MKQIAHPIRAALAAGLIALCLGAATFATTPATPNVVPAAMGAASSPTQAQPQEDIRDIRGPKLIIPAWLLPALLAAGAAIALAAYAAWRWRRRRNVRKLLPFEIALQHLEDLQGLMQPSTAREFSIQASDIVRRYIEQRFHVIASHRTTEEFLRDLLGSADTALAQHRGVLADFLQHCDLAKFAGMSLSIPSMESLRQSARSFVLATVQSVAPQTPDVAAAETMGA